MICVVDNEATIRQMLDHVLTSQGFQTKTYATVDRFLAAFNEPATDCVIADLWMSRPDDWELQRRLNELGPHVSLIICMESVSVAEAVRGIEFSDRKKSDGHIDQDAIVRQFQRGMGSRRTAQHFETN